MKRVHMFPHGGSGNHGCEAIVRTSMELLEGNDVMLYSENPEQDLFYMKDINLIVMKPTWQARKSSPKYWRASLSKVFGNKESYDELYFDPIISNCKQGDILLSIGGDNYCYGDNEFMYLVNRCVRKKGCKTVLWGCSIEPERLSEKMKDDLFKYDLIIARESISYDALRRINKNVILCPDPAFLLQKREERLPEGLVPQTYVGINVSPMIQSNEQKNGITLDNYRSLIQYIIDKTQYNIAFIPHVVWDHNDDRKPLKVLFDEFTESGRVVMVEDQNCMRLKNIISNCKFFVGARTHSTIAAYSSKVPTLVVGYSNKAKGIAKDLFGSYENYVLPVQSLKTPEDLKKAFLWLEENQNTIKGIYDSKMNDYINKVYQYKNALEKL